VNEFFKLLETLGSATIGQALGFAALVVPGLLSLRMYEAKRGGEGRKANDVLIDIIGYSFATDLIAFALLSAVQAIPPSPGQVALRVIVALGAFLIIPVLLGWAWYELQAWMAKVGVVADPVQKPWDKMFRRILAERKDLGIIATLSDGRRVGGRFVDPGYASSAPAPEQLMVGEAWLIDENTGRFAKPVAGSFGLLIDKSDAAVVEFIEWHEVERYLAHAATADPIE
jgi:hypothetical protein